MKRSSQQIENATQDRYYNAVIVSFKDADTERIHHDHQPRRLPQTIVASAQRKLTQLDSCVVLADLRLPPGNRLEKLRGNREGQWSIRVNDQFRICFVWDNIEETGENTQALDVFQRRGNASSVEIVDYH